MKVNIHEAKTRFSQLVEKALRGEEVIISKHGKPLLRLVPIEGQKGQRPVELHPHKLSDAEIEESLKPLGEDELAEWLR
ncbi:type II toxin-antitoxin system prevent-host-death family antitoxin [Meiothermus sp. QL-1]|uniref:type II toxin-antitoxin system Phd/YefM family antitoxin n=1 Tax=Meiothermus sp. QL-1 TaxID=2058095 RepID=UPI000E0B5770|nr:type II toxin-antitoxin system prevent-host-death family antitoxin [Meiothermus sp. QL-1]RDI94942.1 type II toxin-antitoxin system prevent-host-death family antitoxin [Meiothermus sp. QL-1]